MRDFKNYFTALPLNLNLIIFHFFFFLVYLLPFMFHLCFYEILNFLYYQWQLSIITYQFSHFGFITITLKHFDRNYHFRVSFYLPQTFTLHFSICIKLITDYHNTHSKVHHLLQLCLDAATAYYGMSCILAHLSLL